MTQMLTSLENETELESIGRNNDLFEKKCSTFDRQQEEISRSIKNLQTCNSHVKRMTVNTKEKLLNGKANVEKHHKKTQNIVRSLNTSLNSSFEKIDTIRADKLLSFSHGGPSPSITLPYESSIQAAEEEEKRLRSKLQELSLVDDQLKNERESLEKRQHSTLKTKGKLEKEIAQLKGELQQHNNIVIALQRSSSAIEKKLITAKEEISVVTSEKTKLSSEIEEAEKVRDSLLQQVEERKSKVVSDEIVSALDELYSDLNSGEDINMSLVDAIPESEEILQLISELKQLESESSVLPQSAQVSSSEAVASLEASLETIKEQTKSVTKSIEQMKEYNDKYADTVGTLTRKKSDIEDVNKQIAENESVLSRLKVTQHAAKPIKSERRNSKKEEIFRLLEASRNEVPGPKPYQPYQTPSRTASNIQKANSSSTKRSFKAADTIHPVAISNQQYPGITLVSKKESSIGIEENDSLSDDLSSLDTGTTLDESGMNKMFTPPQSYTTHSPEVPKAVEFSMMKHFDDYNKRHEMNFSQMNVTHEQPESDISAGDSDEDEETENADLDDDDDDLMAGDEEMNQSAWGSDD
ncbi:unnamed protein product [Caenorhabditis brenneri]